MQLTLETWYTLSEIGVDEGQLNVRLIPDYFNNEIVDPVITLTVLKPDRHVEFQASLERFRRESVIDIEVSEQVVKLWAEHDDAPTSISGQAASWHRSAYTSTDLMRVVDDMSAQLAISHGEVIALRSKCQDIESYTVELLKRAEAKKNITTRSTVAIDAQMDVLGRILARLKGA